MTEFVFDSLNPKYDRRSFGVRFWNLAENANAIDIAVGYVDVGSVVMLTDAMMNSFDFSLRLFVGMQFHDGFTQPQIDALERLQSFLVENEKGGVFIARRSQYHGKVYNFWSNGKLERVYIGSGNLSVIGNSERHTLEAGVLLDSNLDQFGEYLESLVFPLGDELEIGDLQATLRSPSPLAQMERVVDLGPGMPRELDLFEPTYSFSLPLKCEEKSNLNVVHGDPRTHTKSGRSLPRPWYEVEIIPGVKITRQEGYPLRNSVFPVVTDDNYSFDCTVNGGKPQEPAKNFRSKGDLKPLGGFIKGRLESYGVLRAGEKITTEMLDLYGRHTIDLNYYGETGRWILDFRVEDIG